MLNNFVRIAWRSLTKNRIFSIINILGLAAGIAAFLFIVTYVRFERSYETFNPNADNVWRITLDLYKGSEYVVTDCETHAPIAPLIKNRFPEVVDYVRMYNNDGLRDVTVGDKNFLESGIYYADPSVFNILGVTVIQGDPAKILSEPSQIVLSQSQAVKFFGSTDVVGKSMIIDNRDYHVTGVIADSPANTHLKFKILISHSTLPKFRSSYNDENWGGNNEYSYLLMKPGTDLASFNEKLLTLCEELKDKLTDDKYRAEPIKSIHLYSNKTFEPEVNGNAKAVYFLALIAVFIICIAWVNYMNLATARAVERAKEVGIRKVMGSIRRQLVAQFLTESLIVNLIAAGLGVVIFQSAMPLFNQLTGLPDNIGIATESFFWLMFVGLALAGTLLAGIYPAFVLSSFKPVLVLKGKFQSSSHGQLLRKVLVVFQFGTTIILMIGVTSVYLQVKHMRSIDLGADLEKTVAVRLPAMDVPDSVQTSLMNSFKTEVMRESAVQSVSISLAYPGIPVTELNTNTLSIIGREADAGEYTYYWYNIDQHFAKTMGIQLAAGRGFESDSENGNILINEEAARLLGFMKPEDALGAQINFVDPRTEKNSIIIGVLKNFYQRSPKEEHLPMMFPFSKRGRYVTVRLNTTDPRDVIASVENAWAKVFPGDVFSYSFVNEKYDQQYRADVQFGQVVATFSALAVVIACLGLFGLSSYTIVQRRKEIGIRKVLGASISQIVSLLSGGYIRIIFTASIIALPVAWFVVDNWLAEYSVRISLNAWMFIGPVLLILCTALLTVGVQTVRSALINPANSLKDE